MDLLTGIFIHLFLSR